MLRSCFTIALSIILLGAPGISRAQDKSPYSHPLTPADTVLLNRYLDSLHAVPYFSHKCQRYYDSALMIKPWMAHWWQQKAMMLYKQKKYEAGEPYLDSAVKYDVHAYIDYRGFMKCVFQKKYKDAIGDFEAAKVIIGNSDVMDHTYDFYLGLCFLQLNRLDSAEYYLSKSTNDQKTTMGDKWVHPLDWFYLGMVYYEKEDYAQAITCYDNALKLYTNFSDVEYYRSICLKRLHRDAEALTMMKTAYEDFKQGYTINEDNVIYENYPYQVIKPKTYTEVINWMEGKE